MTDSLRNSKSDRFKAALKKAAKKAADPRRARGIFGTRLAVAGVALICVAGGIDYFQHAEEIKQAATGIARASGHTSIADAVDALDRSVASAKEEAISALPPVVREHLSTAALLLGALCLFVGARLKTRASDEPGRAVRDIGRVIAGPGFFGIAAFTFLTLRSYRLRVALESFWARVEGGLSGSDLWELTKRYAPWAWNELAPVLIIGVVLFVLAVVFRLIPTAEDSPHRPRLRFIHRFTLWASLLALAYYGVATAAAVASYGSALTPFLTWPWKLTPGAFLSSIALMALGIALARTGTAIMKRESASS